jgi:HEPN domain-containing protein
MSGRYQILSRNREIARAYLKEAAADVNSAKLLIAGGEHSQTIVHCQHAVEKTLKAALTEYPFFGRPDLPIWIPSERYDRADAENALAKARYVFEAVGALLREAYAV